MRWVLFIAEPAVKWDVYPFFASLVAYHRRRTRLYGVVAVVVGALLARTIIGLGTVFEVVSMSVHHLVAHGLDFIVAALILYAVYMEIRRFVTPRLASGHGSRGRRRLSRAGA